MGEDGPTTFEELAAVAVPSSAVRTLHVEGDWVGLASSESGALAEEVLRLLGHAPLGPWVRRTRFLPGEWNGATSGDAARRSERGAVLVVHNYWYGALIGDALASSHTLRLEDGGCLSWTTIDSCSMSRIDVELAAGTAVGEAELESTFRAAAASRLRGWAKP